VRDVRNLRRQDDEEEPAAEPAWEPVS
jgi:hypothetical protein